MTTSSKQAAQQRPRATCFYAQYLLVASAAVLTCSGPLGAQQTATNPEAAAAAAKKEGAPAPGSPGAQPATPVPSGAWSSSGCDSTNVVQTARVYGDGLKGNPRVAADGVLAVESSFWSSPSAVVLKKETTGLMVDFGRPRNVGAVLVQGDNNDIYEIQGSLDGQSYQTLWTAVAVFPAQGLRTRWGRLPRVETVRYLRVMPQGGDKFYSVSELQAYCNQPANWSPALTFPPEKTGWAAIDDSVVVFLKGLTAGLGGLLLLWTFLLHRRGRPHYLKKLRDGLLAGFGIFSFLLFWNLGHFHYDHYIHIWEHYHYYVGAKYAPELGYSRLYECTTAADIADGHLQRVKDRKMRNLVTNELGSTEHIIKDPTLCTRHFSKERWEEFRADIRKFRGFFPADRWDQSQTDHGFNATPVWTIAGRALAATFPIKSWNTIIGLGIVDSVLLIGMWAAVWWAFGWRSMCVALLWWGTNFPARYFWTGGAYLRMDWIAFLVLGLCLLRKDKMFSGGLALTYAALLRIFPGFVVIAMILKALMYMVRERRWVLSSEHKRFAAGCLVALAALMPLSAVATGSLSSWVVFAQNSAKHLDTPLTNNMGLKTAIGFEFDKRAIGMRNDDLSDPFGDWKERKRETYAARKPLLLLLIASVLFMVAIAVEREKDWVAACVGAGLIPVMAELTCYYYGFLLAYGLLWKRHKLPAIVACAMSMLTCMAPTFWPWTDDHFTAMGMIVSFGIFLVSSYLAYSAYSDRRTALGLGGTKEQGSGAAVAAGGAAKTSGSPEPSPTAAAPAAPGEASAGSPGAATVASGAGEQASGAPQAEARQTGAEAKTEVGAETEVEARDAPVKSKRASGHKSSNGGKGRKSRRKKHKKGRPASASN
ncbi:MAG: discoidin domain-containing protein [Proteobacteria bacterium]|nr:discoidin domain-containing protein [Pseudomonadota bacterium]